MSDILPPQLVGVQHSSLYVKVRKIVTVTAVVWLILAVTGLGFFSGGTTSLALSLILMYGTGAALIVVIAAIYRGIKISAIKRSETAPEDTAALAFIDATRSAADELHAALRPAPPTGRAYDPSDRTVGPAVSMIEAVAAARAASNAAAIALFSAPAVTEAGRTDGSAKDNSPAAAAEAGPAAAKAVVKTAAHGAGAPGKQAAVKTAASKPAAAKATGAKPVSAKTSAAKASAVKTTAAKKPAGKSAAKPAAAKTSAAKTSAARTTGTKPAGSKPGQAKDPGKPAAKKQAPRPAAQQSKKKAAAGVPVAAASPACPQPAKIQRPALVLASSNPVPQAVRKVHDALVGQKAS